MIEAVFPPSPLRQAFGMDHDIHRLRPTYATMHASTVAMRSVARQRKAPKAQEPPMQNEGYILLNTSMLASIAAGNIANGCNTLRYRKVLRRQHRANLMLHSFPNARTSTKIPKSASKAGLAEQHKSDGATVRFSTEGSQRS